MRRRRVAALFAGAVVTTLAWPSPVHAQTELGGYSGSARAFPLRFEIVDPTIPLPSDPQVDFGFAYTRSVSETGPASRATASYLWPGDVIGDGFDQLTGKPGSKYPVQVNSRYPATTTAPAKNDAQLTDGNGMATSSNTDVTTATVTGLGVTGAGTNLLGGTGSGLCQSLTPDPSKCPKTPAAAPVPVPAQVAAVMTVANVHSRSSITLVRKAITASAEATASDIALLGGVIGIKDVQVTATSASDGAKATNSGKLTIGGITVAGKDYALDEKGVDLAGKTTRVPTVPDALSKIGISFSYQPSAAKLDGATGSLDATGLVISIDTALVKKALTPLTGALSDLLGKIPHLEQVQALLGLGPRFNFLVGDVSTSVTAAPAYVAPPLPGGGPTTGGGAVAGGGSASGGGGPVSGTGGGGIGGGTGAGGDTSPIAPGTTPPTTGGGTPAPTLAQATAFGLPPLGTVPKLLVLAALALAIAFGWVFRTAGGLLLGTSRNCTFGLDTGVPDLRRNPS